MGTMPLDGKPIVVGVNTKSGDADAGVCLVF